MGPCPHYSPKGRLPLGTFQKTSTDYYTILCQTVQHNWALGTQRKHLRNPSHPCNGSQLCIQGKSSTLPNNRSVIIRGSAKGHSRWTRLGRAKLSIDQLVRRHNFVVCTASGREELQRAFDQRCVDYERKVTVHSSPLDTLKAKED